jgi:uncharacterized protein (TIGR00255 family)
MISSMTGFGKASVTYNEKTIKTEIRSLNSKNLDLTVKLPALFRDRENMVRSLVGNKLERGKIELIVSIEYMAGQGSAALNVPLLMQYFKQVREVADELQVNISNDFLPDLLRLPDILKPQAEEADMSEWPAIEQCILLAIEQVEHFRISEGKHLYGDITAREKIIRELLRNIEPMEKQRIANIRDRIMRSLNEIAEDVKVDQNRFEQEVIFYLEKLDITEEKVRLRKHLEYFDETLCYSLSAGKKLGFIAQEIGREINTIGSKANDAAMQQIVVQMKDELEKIKEQLMNVL